jgi:hypothetical protein
MTRTGSRALDFAVAHNCVFITRHGRSTKPREFVSLWGSTRSWSLQLDIGGPEHAAPFVDFVTDELVEGRRRHRDWNAA